MQPLSAADSARRDSRGAAAPLGCTCTGGGYAWESQRPSARTKSSCVAYSCAVYTLQYIEHLHGVWALLQLGDPK